MSHLLGLSSIFASTKWVVKSHQTYCSDRYWKQKCLHLYYYTQFASVQNIKYTPHQNDHDIKDPRWNCYNDKSWPQSKQNICIVLYCIVFEDKKWEINIMRTELFTLMHWVWFFVCCSVDKQRWWASLLNPTQWFIEWFLSSQTHRAEWNFCMWKYRKTFSVCYRCVGHFLMY